MNAESDVKNGMKLIDEVVRCLRQAKVLKEFEFGVNHIDFSPNAENLIASGEDDQIVVYSCASGQKKNVIFSKKYGVDLVQFAPSSDSSAIYASTKVDDTIRLLNLEDNKYIRYFKGHLKKVIGVQVSAKDPSFASGSLDGTVKVWDVRSNVPSAFISVTGKPLVTYDPEGALLATFHTPTDVGFYDPRKLTKGPFKTFNALSAKEDPTCLKFSPNGRQVLVATTDQIQLFDAFSGLKSQISFGGHCNRKKVPLEASFSPDSNYVFSGSSDGKIHVWNAQQGYKVCVLDSDATEPIRCVKFSPKHVLLATGCSVLSFWLPDIKKDTSAAVKGRF